MVRIRYVIVLHKKNIFPFFLFLGGVDRSGKQIDNVSDLPPQAQAIFARLGIKVIYQGALTTIRVRLDLWSKSIRRAWTTVSIQL